MGCTPTAHRQGQIPLNNVISSSRSTRSTIKNSDQLPQPCKLNFNKQSGQKMQKLNRYYSPKNIPNKNLLYIPQAKISVRSNNNTLKDSQQKKVTHGQELKRHLNDQIETVSHLSLNSHLNSRQDIMIEDYEALTMRKNSPRVINVNKKSNKQINPYQHRNISNSDKRGDLKRYVDEKQNYQTPSHKQNTTNHKNSHNNTNNNKRILQRQLSNMNNQSFKRIQILKMHF